MLSEKGTKGDYAGTTPCYWLMNALSLATQRQAWASRRQDEKIVQAIIEIINRLFEKITCHARKSLGMESNYMCPQL